MGMGTVEEEEGVRDLVLGEEIPRRIECRLYPRT